MARETKKVRVDLKEFMAHGVLGPVRLGMTRRELLVALGKPDDFHSDHRILRKKTLDNSSIWMYGDFEFFFQLFLPSEGRKRKDGWDCPLDLIHVDDRGWSGVCRGQPPSGGKRILVDPWVIRQGMTRRSFQMALRKEGIPFELIDWPLRDETVRLWVGPGVIAIFSTCREVPEFRGLSSLSFSRKPHPWDLRRKRK